MNHRATCEGIPRVKELGSVGGARFHYMDNLRALAMLVGVIYHAALAYSPMFQQVWFTADSVNSPAIDYVVNFLHLFRMPLFFMISGFCALMLIDKRGITKFLKNRVLRVFLPLVIFLPLIMISFGVVFSWAINNVETPPVMLQFLFSDGAKMEPKTAHLWFLFNLFLFCLCLSVLARLKLFHTWIVTCLSSKAFLVVFFPLLLVPALFSQTAPHPVPDNLYPQLWSFGFYGVFLQLAVVYFSTKA